MLGRVRSLRRRDFIALLGGAVTASSILRPLGARAQQADKMTRIGFLGASLNSSAMAANYQIFLAQLRELGFSQGQNLIVEYRTIDEPRGPFAVAAELMRLQVDLLVATGPEVVLQAVVGASRSIPIVILAIQYDPVERGYVASRARPGGNITGLSYRQPELAAKQLELLTQAFPERRRLAILWDALSRPINSPPPSTRRSPCLWSSARRSSKSRRMISLPRFGPWRRAALKWSSSCPALISLNTVGRSWNSQSGIACPPCLSSSPMSK